MDCSREAGLWGSGGMEGSGRGTDLGELGKKCISETLPISAFAPVSVTSQQRDKSKPRFHTPLVPISELTSTPLALSEAYIRLSALLPNSMPSSFSPAELRLEDYFDLFRAILADLAVVWPPQEAICSVLGAFGLLVDQLEDCWKAGNEAEKRCEALQSAEADIKHRLEMAETRCKLLFDKVQQQESSEDTSLGGIEWEIERKEGEIVRLEQAIRRLTSRKVLRDMSETETAAALQLRSVRDLRSRPDSITPTRPGSITPTRKRSPFFPSPTKSLSDLSECTHKDSQRKLSRTVTTLDSSLELEPLTTSLQHSFSIRPVKGVKEKSDRSDCCPAF